MSKSRIEWRVGLFVLIGLALLAALMLQFSKGLTFFQPTYEIYLKTPNTGGLKKNAAVLMSGVQIGSVTDLRLSPGGRTVTLTLRILKEYTVRQGSKFVIEQSGFLGDQYVAIVPTENQEAPPYKDKEVAEAEAPFNLQEFTRTASDFITRVDDTVKKLNDALDEVTRILLNPQTLTNLSVTIANMRSFSDRALTTIDRVNQLVATNSPSVSLTASNLVLFSDQLNQFGGELRTTLASNTNDLAQTVKNIESSSESLKALMSDLQAGKGLAGNLLKNEQLAEKVSEIANNLSVTTSNLNRLGLWGILWRHKPPRTNATPAEVLLSPKDSD